MSFKLLHIESDAAGAPDSGGGGSERVAVPERGLEYLRRLPPRATNLISIWGPARTGKSFLMNVLARTDDLFPVSSDMAPCTAGADMSTAVQSLGKFEGAPPVEESGESSPLIGFVDVEGLGDKHVSYEIMLTTPILLLSKVAIFNWSGAPNKSTVLDRLAAMRHSATVLSRRQRKNAFGHLIVLLRNVYEGEEDAKRVIFDLEDPDDAETDEEEQQIQERNEAREDLSRSFCSIRVWCLPSPHPDAYARVVGRHEVAPEFTAKVDQLRVLVAGMAKEPHRFGDTPIQGGRMLELMLDGVCKAVNRDAKDISPLSMADSIHQRRAEVAFERCKDFFLTQTLLSTDGELKSSSEPEGMLEEAKVATLARFTEEVEGLSDKVISESRQKLEGVIDEQRQRYSVDEKEQLVAVRAKVAELVITTDGHADEKVSEISAMLPITADRELERLWDGACRDLHRSFEDEVRQHIPDGFTEDLQIPNVEEFKSIFSCKLDYLMAQNQMIIQAKGEDDATVQRVERGGIRDRHERGQEEEVRSLLDRLRQPQAHDVVGTVKEIASMSTAVLRLVGEIRGRIDVDDARESSSQLASAVRGGSSIGEHKTSGKLQGSVYQGDGGESRDTETGLGCVLGDGNGEQPKDIVPKYGFLAVLGYSTNMLSRTVSLITFLFRLIRHFWGPRP